MHDFTVEQRIFEKKRVTYQWRTGPNFRESIDYEGEYELDFDRAIHRLEAYVFAERLADDYYEDTFYYDVPHSTWQTFKHLHAEAWWMRWLVNRRPVKKQTKKLKTAIEVKRYVGYPEASLSVPNLGHGIPFEEIRPLEHWEVALREKEKQLAEAVEEDKHVVETYLVVDETLDDLAAATGLSREWFEHVQAFDQEFGLQSKIYVIPRDIHHEEV